jgi:hypothetical protein
MIVEEAPLVFRTGTIYNKTKHFLGYADDIVLISRTEAALNEMFLALEREVRKVRLVVNERKTKVMYVSRKQADRHEWEVGRYKFEIVSQFIYLVSEINNSNEETE